MQHSYYSTNIYLKANNQIRDEIIKKHYDICSATYKLKVKEYYKKFVRTCSIYKKKQESIYLKCSLPTFEYLPTEEEMRKLIENAIS